MRANRALAAYFARQPRREEYPRSIHQNLVVAVLRSAHPADHVFCIFIAHLCDDDRDFSLCLIGRSNQGQAHLGRHGTEQTQCIFERNGIGLAEERIGQLRDRISQPSALTICPCLHARNMPLQSPGATLDVTEMQPLPPWARNASAVASSPERSLKSGPTTDLKRAGRVTSPGASFRPMNCGISARRTTVSSARPHAVLDGTS
jgi:hypothetical protein